MARRDQELLDDLRCGTRGARACAFEALRERYGLRLLAFARRLARGDNDLAVDLVQDTWLSLFHDLAHRRVVLRNESFGGLLVTLVRRQASRRFRRTEEVLMESVDFQPSAPMSIAASLDRHALLGRIAAEPQRWPIHHAVLVEHQDHGVVRDAWCRRTGSKYSAFYKSRKRESEELQAEAGSDAARCDA